MLRFEFQIYRYGKAVFGTQEFNTIEEGFDFCDSKGYDVIGYKPVNVKEKKLYRVSLNKNIYYMFGWEIENYQRHKENIEVLSEVGY